MADTLAPVFRVGNLCYDFVMPAKKSSKKKSSDMSTLDAGGGLYGLIDGLSGRNDPGNSASFTGAMRPDIRGVYGSGPYDFPDPYKPPVQKKLPSRTKPTPPSTKKPAPKPSPKKKRGSAGGSSALGVD